MFKILIKKDWVGNLAFSFFSVGNMVNEQWIFPPGKRKVLSEGQMSPEPTFMIPNMQASEFMYALKEAIKEYEGSTPDFSQGELKATKAHLNDMRKLIFYRYGIKDDNQA